MTTIDHIHHDTPASEMAHERMLAAIDMAAEGRSPYPSGTAFVGADVPELGPVIARYARERRPVLLVYPDGDERLLRCDVRTSWAEMLRESAARALGRRR